MAVLADLDQGGSSFFPNRKGTAFSTFCSIFCSILELTGSLAIFVSWGCGRVPTSLPRRSTPTSRGSGGTPISGQHDASEAKNLWAYLIQFAGDGKKK
jgi:hypothetical protein